jgi:hypothetical protein
MKNLKYIPEKQTWMYIAPAVGVKNFAKPQI